MKQKPSWYWRNAENLLAIVFLATFTLNIRKVFLTPFSYLNGEFNEYMTISLSWADVLMIGAIIIYTTKYIISQFYRFAQPKIKQYNNNNLLSNISTFRFVSYETIILLIFFAWTGLSIIWSPCKPIAIYRFLILAEIIYFLLIAIQSLRISKWLNLAIFALIINGVFQSSLGIAQFVHNGSLNLHMIGESFVGPNIDGVAKIVINGEEHIRAYGTLPHPNILAGFLIIPLFLVLSQLISRCLNINSKNILLINSSISNFKEDDSHHIVARETLLNRIPSWLLLITLSVMGLGFVLTFSRSAFLALSLGLFCYYIWILKTFQFPHNLKINFKYLLIFFSALLVIGYALYIHSSFYSDQSLNERILYKNVSYETIYSHPLQGVGIGQFVLNEYILHPDLAGWQYQPVHNIYLLLFSELGFIGFILFFVSIIFFFLNMKIFPGGDARYKLTGMVFYCIIISYLSISFFDHYFWDIKTGTIIFVLPLIFLATIENLIENISVEKILK